MSETSIEWTHPPGFKGATWNPVVGCRRVSPGCEHCYAETMAGRLARMGQARYLDVVKVDDKGQPRGRWNGTYREVPEVLDLPLRTKRPTCYFVNSMSDLFGEGVSDGWIAAVFGVMAACPQHRFLILTKRAERMATWFKWAASTPHRPGGAAEECFWQASDRLPAKSGYAEDIDHRLAESPAWPLPNAWIGVSVEDQQRADERIPHLFSTPAAVRFLSVEPQLGPIDLSRYSRAVCATVTDVDPDRQGFSIQTTGRALHWTIVGGESGPGARPFDLAWARSLVAQCKASGVACFVKQLGARPTLVGGASLVLASRKGGDLSEWPADLRVRAWPDVRT